MSENISLFIDEDDLSGDCDDWLSEAATKRFIDAGCTHLSMEGWGDNELVEAEVITFPSGGRGVLLGEQVTVEQHTNSTDKENRE